MSRAASFREPDAEIRTSGSRWGAPFGMIQIELPKGRLRLTGCVHAEALRVVLKELLG